jgi:ketosteroid isomerase-like protein
MNSESEESSAISRNQTSGFGDQISNRDRVERLFAAINTKKTSIDDLLAEDLSWWIIGDIKSSGIKDKRTILIGIKLLHRIYQGFAFTLHDFTAEGARVAVTAESHGIHKSGKIYHNHYHFLFKLRDGKIREVREYFDTKHAAWIEEG